MIAILEDDGPREQAFRRVLNELGQEQIVEVFLVAPDMIAWLEDHLGECALISLDHDLGPTFERDGERIDPGDGRDVTNWLGERPPACPVIVHTSNPLYGPSMEVSLQIAGWEVERVIPIGDLEWVDSAWRSAVERCVLRRQ